MTVSRIGSLAALLGGLAWVVAAVLSWGEDALNRPLYLAGLVLLVLAFAALGYSLVATAPVWLRAVVTVATPLLGLMLWLILRDSVASDDVAAMVGGVLLLVGGGIALGRGRRADPGTGAGPGGPARPEPPAHGRRAAR